MSIDLFVELEKAIADGDTVRAEQIKRSIMRGLSRDESLDENLMSALKGKQIHKNLCRVITEDVELSEHDYLKMVSSLITHIVIESEIHEKDLKDFPIKELYVLLGELLNGEVGAIDEFREFVKERYEEFLL